MNASDAAGGARVERFPTRIVLGILAFGVVASLVLLSPDARMSRAVARWTAELADPERQTVAYQRLLEAGPRAVPPLLEVAADARAAQRGLAIELLGRLGDPKAVPVVLACDDPALAGARVEALGRLRGEAALRAVRAALQGDLVDLKFPALRVLADWPDAPTADLLPDVQPYLEHEVPGLRELAAKFMGARKHGPAQPALIRLLGDPDASVRQAAAWALVQLGTPEGVAAVDSAIEAGKVIPEED